MKLRVSNPGLVLLSIAVLVLIAMGLVVGSKGISAQTSYTLTATADPSDGSGGYVEITGGVLIRAGTKLFSEGATAWLQAHADSGWRFIKWSGDLSGTASLPTLKMNSNKSVTAHFERIPSTPTYTLTATANPSDGSGGYVEISGGTLVRSGTKRFDQGETATVEARSNTGWRFASWSGALSGSTARQTLTMNSNQTVAARFERVTASTQTYILTTEFEPADGSAGYVEITGGVKHPDGTVHFNAGDRALINARTNPDWEFVRWSGHADVLPSASAQTILMDANKTVTAHWTRHGKRTETAIAPTTQSASRKTLTARIEARRLIDGQIEFALRPHGEHRILPGRRFFPASAAIDRWLQSSTIEHLDQTIGKITARRLADARTEFSFLTASSEEIAPHSRLFRAGSAATGWSHSSWFEIPIPTQAQPNPVSVTVAFTAGAYHVLEGDIPQIGLSLTDPVEHTVAVLVRAPSLNTSRTVVFSPGQTNQTLALAAIAELHSGTTLTITLPAAAQTDGVIVGALAETDVHIVSLTAAAARIAELYAPNIVLDSREHYYPVGIEAMLDYSVLRRREAGLESTIARGSQVAVEHAEDEVWDSGMSLRLTPDLLGNIAYAASGWDTYLDFDEDKWREEQATPSSLTNTHDYPSTVYARVAFVDQLLVIQYWLFYVYNPGPAKFAGIDVQTHEGDWEGLMIIFPAGTSIDDVLSERAGPTLVGYAAHGEMLLDVWNGGCGRPRGRTLSVFPARGSHATFPLPGTHLTKVAYGGVGVSDSNDGIGVVLYHAGPAANASLPYDLVVLDASSDWLEWNGRWGSGTNEYFRGPHGPKWETYTRQREIWNHLTSVWAGWRVYQC